MINWNYITKLEDAKRYQNEHGSPFILNSAQAILLGAYRQYAIKQGLPVEQFNRIAWLLDQH